MMRIGVSKALKQASVLHTGDLSFCWLNKKSNLTISLEISRSIILILNVHKCHVIANFEQKSQTLHFWVRILAMYEAKSAQISNFWTVWPIIWLISHLSNIWQSLFCQKRYWRLWKDGLLGKIQARIYRSCWFLAVFALYIASTLNIPCKRENPLLQKIKSHNFSRNLQKSHFDFRYS